MKHKPSSGTLASPIRLRWQGPKSGCFEWLYAQVASLCQVVREEPDGGEEADRLLIACPDRLSYPKDLGHRADLPTALATSNWWDGSGRTGLAKLEVPAIPWYRWWDVWIPWLNGAAPDLFSPIPPRLVQSIWLPVGGGRFLPASGDGESAKLEDARIALSNHGLVIADCSHCGQAWTAMAKELGSSADWLSSWQWDSMLRISPESRIPPDWILWDDSALSTFDRDSDSQRCIEFIAHARDHFPAAIRIAAFSMPRAETWKAVWKNGLQAILAKPSTGSVLGRILMPLQSIDD